MTVRPEIVEPLRETGVQSLEDPEAHSYSMLRVLRGQPLAEGSL
jgi:hypothetical protein